MQADESILHRLDAATKAPYWPVGVDGPLICVRSALCSVVSLNVLFLIFFHEAPIMALT